MACFMNKVLLEHSYTHYLHIVYVFFFYVTETDLNSCVRDYMVHEE